jgi:site-specific recombinase XerD
MSRSVARNPLKMVMLTRRACGRVTVDSLRVARICARRRSQPRWHDLRREGACRLLANGVDIRIIQLMLGHASIQQTQRYLNVTDEELRRGLEVSWINQGRPLRAVSGN